jgi:hypothetical protein
MLRIVIGALGAFAMALLAMAQATGMYWKPIWHILEGRFELAGERVAWRRRLWPAVQPCFILL